MSPAPIGGDLTFGCGKPRPWGGGVRIRRAIGVFPDGRGDMVALAQLTNAVADAKALMVERT